MTKTAVPPKPKAPEPIVENIPKALAGHSSFVVWRYEYRQDKWTKVPYQSLAPQKRAKTSDSGTWASMGDALNAYHKRALSLDGIGFVFSEDDPYCGVDFDGCLGPDGELLDWARPYLDALMPTYAEISPSGRGVKLFVRGKLPGKGTRRGGFGPDGSGAIEVYDRLRFFTLTGRRYSHVIG
jgi:putative DNA primase/helicase